MEKYIMLSNNTEAGAQSEEMHYGLFGNSIISGIMRVGGTQSVHSFNEKGKNRNSVGIGE
jgi:hypothetical protein